jgi:hypothetical protein
MLQADSGRRRGGGIKLHAYPPLLGVYYDIWWFTDNISDYPVTSCVYNPLSTQGWESFRWSRILQSWVSRRESALLWGAVFLSLQGWAVVPKELTWWPHSSVFPDSRHRAEWKLKSTINSKEQHSSLHILASQLQDSDLCAVHLCAVEVQCVQATGLQPQLLSALGSEYSNMCLLWDSCSGFVPSISSHQTFQEFHLPCFVAFPFKKFLCREKVLMWNQWNIWWTYQDPKYW